jgi:hypothetical protein
MPKQIRTGVFETNSSSTHALCIARSNDFDIPFDTLEFEYGEFGWEQEVYDTIPDRASYLYTALRYTHYHQEAQLQKKLDFIAKTLEKRGVQAIFKPAKETRYGTDDGYVDHAGDLVSLLDRLTSHEQILLRFLYSPYTVIVTGNDNDESSEAFLERHSPIDSAHEYIYKGN